MHEGLNQLESRADLIERLQKSMVRINVLRNSPSVPVGGESLSLRIEKVPNGSGFFVGKDLIITSRHVVGSHRTPVTVDVYGEDGPLSVSDEASVVYVDPILDIALIKTRTAIEDVTQLGDSDKIRIGDDVLVLGSPLRGKSHVSRGIISGFNGSLMTTDVSLHGGHSGGPMVSEDTGEVVGVNTAIVLGNGTGAIGHAIPINDVKKLLKELSVETKF